MKLPEGFVLERPSPPEGFVLDEPGQDGASVGGPKPPKGFVLDSPPVGFRGRGATGTWETNPASTVFPAAPITPRQKVNPLSMQEYNDALTLYISGNRDLAKAKAKTALAIDNTNEEARNMLRRFDRDAEAGTRKMSFESAQTPLPQTSMVQGYGQAVTDLGDVVKDTYRAVDQSPIVRSLGAGANRIYANLARVPNLASNIFALPYNAVVEMSGRPDLALKSPKLFEKEALWWDEKAQQLSYGHERWGSKGEDLVAVAKRKDPAEITKYIAYKVLEEAPQQAIMLGMILAGSPAAGLAYMGTMAAANEQAEGEKSEAGPSAVAVNSVVNGLAEAAFEATPALMGKWGKVLAESFGQQNVSKIVKNVAKTIVSSIVQEGPVEEGATEVFQSISQKLTGVNPNALNGLLNRVVEASVIGGAMGGGMTAPAAIGQGIYIRGQNVAPIDKVGEQKYRDIVGDGGVPRGNIGPQGGSVSPTPSGVVDSAPHIRLNIPPFDPSILQSPDKSQPTDAAPVPPTGQTVVSPPPGFVLDAGPAQAQGSAPVLPAPPQPTVTRPAPVLPAAEQQTIKQRPQVPRAKVDPVELERYPAEDREGIKSLAESLTKSYMEEYNLAREQYSLWQDLIGNGVAPNADEMGEYKTLPLHMRRTKANGGTPVDIIRQQIMEDPYYAPLQGRIKGGNDSDIYEALRGLKAPARPVMDPNYYLSEAANIYAYNKEVEQESMRTDEEPPAYLDALEFEGQFQAGELFEAPKENVGQTFNRLVARARAQGMAIPDAVKYAKRTIASQTRGQVVEQAEPKQFQREMTVPGGVQGFGTGQRGQAEMFQADSTASGTKEGQTDALAAFKKIISANRMTDATFAELVDSIRPDPVAFRKGYGTEYQADKFVIRGATYPVRNHATIKALVRFAKGAHKGTGYHEAMHVIFNNILTAQERQVLMDKFKTEENAAEAFAKYEQHRTGQEKDSRIKAIFDKILEFLGRLQNYINGKGWKTAEDVFRSVEEGRTESQKIAGKEQAQYQAEKIENNKAMLPNGGYVPLAKLSKLQRIYREWLTTDRGVGKAIDRANEERIGRIMETAFDAPLTGKELLKYFKKNPSEGLRHAIYDALTGQRSIDELPADITGIVQRMRDDVDALSMTIAQTAAPNERLKAVIERNLGRYLGRHYRLFERKKWRPSNEVISRAKAKLREMHPNTIGKASSEELNGIIENIISKGDVTFYRGDRRIDIPQNHFIKRKDIPKEIRDLYGEITDPVWAYLKTRYDQAAIAHNAEFLNRISTMEGAFKDKPDETHYKQIPDTARWGAVKGKYTTPEVNNFLIEAISPVDSELMRAIENYLVNPYKWSKTVASLPSHPRNFLGNIMFSILAGNTITNPMNIPYYWKALRVIMGKEGEYRNQWKELVRARVVDTQYWGSEMPKLMAEMISDPASWPDKIMNTAKWPVEKLGELYNNEDLIYRVSAFLKYRDNGMTVNQSAQEVDKWFTNYARLPKAVKTARRLGVFGPFLSFKANTARILITAMKESSSGLKNGNPVPAMRLAFVLSMISGLELMFREIFDIGDEDEKALEKLQNLGPVYRRNSSPIYYRDGEGKIKTFDLGYIWPTGDFQKAGKAALAGDVESFVDTIDLFQHPLFDAYSVLFNNYNTRTRQNVSNVNDPLPRRTADKMAEVVRQIYVPASSPIPSIIGLKKGRFEPGLLTGYQIKILYDAFHGVQDRFGRTREVPEELRSFMTGIRTWQIHPDDIVESYVRRKAGEMFEVRSEARRFLRMKSISPDERKKRLDDLKRRAAKIGADVKAARELK